MFSFNENPLLACTCMLYSHGRISSDLRFEYTHSGSTSPRCLRIETTRTVHVMLIPPNAFTIRRPSQREYLVRSPLHKVLCSKQYLSCITNTHTSKRHYSTFLETSLDPEDCLSLDLPLILSEIFKLPSYDCRTAIPLWAQYYPPLKKFGLWP